MQHKYLLTLLGVFLCYFQVYSQDITPYIPPSPNATALAKFANIPVSLYTGTPQINIPLHQIQSRTLSVPISLSYHASGIKVQDIASSVGTGWAFNAGGVVTRVIRGLPDEADNGYCGKNKIGKKANDPLSSAYANKVKQGIWDAEPDLFYFNFLGRTGKFILNEYGEPVIFPAQSIKIIRVVDLIGGISWLIITEDGATHTFGATMAREYTTYQTTGGQESGAIPTSWYLETIEDANHTDKITFEYLNAGEIAYTYYRQIAKDVTKTQGTNNAFCINEASKTTVIKDTDTQIKVKNSIYLQKIRYARGSIYFQHNYTRADLKGAGLLDKIYLYDEQGAIIKYYDLDYWFNNIGYASERMFLDQIKEIVWSTKAEKTPYTFIYNTDVNLPPRNSHQIDHWGYYNSNAASSKIPAMTFENKNYEGASKEPDPVRTQANILTQINYITGGYTKFVYEPHKYGNLNKLTGGARIKQIIESDGMDESKNLIKNYSYPSTTNPVFSSGQIFRLPIYHHATYTQKSITKFPENTLVSCREDYLMRSSHSYADLFDMNGSHIGYSQVILTLPDQSKMIHTFTNFSDYPDQLAEKVDYKNPQESTPILPNEPPFAPSTFVGWRRGLPKEETVFDAQNRLQQKVSYTYTTDNKNYPKTTAWIVYVKGNSQSCLGQCNDANPLNIVEYTLARYEILTEAWLLKQKIEESYDQGQTEKKTTKVSQFTYNDYLQLQQQTQYKVGDEKRYLTDYKYCTDYPYNEPNLDANLWGWYMLFEKGIIAQPTEIIQHTQTIKDEPLVTLSATLNLFKVQFNGENNKNALVLPAKTLEFKAAKGVLDFNFANIGYNPNQEPHFYIDFDPRYDTVQTFNTYDEAGYLTQKTTQNGSKLHYKWSYEKLQGQKLLVAEASPYAPYIFNDFEDYKTGKPGREGSRGSNLSPQLPSYDLLLLPNRPYIFSCWVNAEKAGKLWLVHFENGKKVDSTAIEFEATQNKWVYVEKNLQLTKKVLTKLTADVEVKIDDIILQRPDTYIKTYIYQLPYGISAVTEADKKVTRYKYDEWGRFKMLLDNEYNIRKHHQYYYPENK